MLWPDSRQRRSVPVIAKGAGLVPEIRGGAGVLCAGLDARELAELMRRVLSDGPLRREVAE